jgi:nucleotide-binding universal stress UspA family protein
MSRPIVVGFDGSEAGREALQWACREAVSRQEPVVIVVSAPSPPVDYYGVTDPMTDVVLMEAITKRGEGLVAEGIRLAAGYGVPDASGTLWNTDPSRAILDAAEGAAMVVVGSRGVGGFLGLALGSVSRQVATHSRCPAVIVRAPKDPDSRELVVGVDGSPPSTKAIDFAFDMASRHGYSIRILHTWDLPPIGAITGVPRFSTPESIDELQDTALRNAAEVLAGHRETYPDVEVVQDVHRGAPVKELAAASEHAAMVVIGSRGRGGFAGLLLGSVSHGVAHHAHCSVAVIHR